MSRGCILPPPCLRPQWSGDLRFLRRLAHPGQGVLGAAFDEIARVVDYADTTTKTWARRVKGGGHVPLRRSGEAPVDASPTFCDELSGWSAECRGSDAEKCEAHVATATTCKEFCESQVRRPKYELRTGPNAAPNELTLSPQ